MAVATGPPAGNKGGEHTVEDHRQWLRKWAGRMWVLPELLLAPPIQDFRLYTETSDTGIVRVTKRDLANRACFDAEYIRQLIDHYEGSIQLSRLELVGLAVECLNRRIKQTQAYTSASSDLAYALKGLLRRRPKFVDKESGFEVFASLSLANDSAQILERLICVLPTEPTVDWYQMDDAWRIKLWDIEPRIQIAGIVDDRSVLVDGAVGASITWKRLKTVHFEKRKTIWRTIAVFLVRFAPGWLLVSIITLADSAAGPKIPHYTNPAVVSGAIFFVFALIIVLGLPWYLRKLYRGKFARTQGWFFGIEGAVTDLGEIERKFFGFNDGRLKWSTSSSLLSRHQPNKLGERQGLAPNRRNIREIGHSLRGTAAATAGLQQRIFTIIDTYSMEASMFYAYHPPTAVFICGAEGGMQRAVLCSYDWKTQTFCRETVLRLKSIVVDKMLRVDRFRFAFRRPDEPRPNGDRARQNAVLAQPAFSEYAIGAKNISRDGNMA